MRIRWPWNITYFASSERDFWKTSQSPWSGESRSCILSSKEKIGPRQTASVCRNAAWEGGGGTRWDADQAAPGREPRVRERERAKGRGFRDHSRRRGHCKGDASAFRPKSSVATPSLSSAAEPFFDPQSKSAQLSQMTKKSSLPKIPRQRNGI